MADEVTTSSFLDSMKSATVTTGKVIGGGAEIVLAGAYNTAVEAVAGLVSIPAVFSSVDKAVAIQDSVKERWGYEIKSEGAQTIFETASEVIPDELPELYEEKKKQVQIAIEENLGPEAGLVIGIGVEAGSEIFGGVAKKAGGSIAKGAEAAKDAKEAAQKAKKGTADVSNEAAADCKLEKANGKPGDKGGSESETDDITELEAGKKGGWNKELNGNLKPNHKYKANGYLYETDELGRVKRVSGKLDLDKNDRNTYQQGKAGKTDGIKDGLENDEGGHLVASIFKGPGEQINYSAMDGNLNKGAWKKMENKWAEALKEGKTVDVDIQMVYDEVSKRPTKFISKYSIEGIPEKTIFKNKPGG